MSFKDRFSAQAPAYARFRPRYPDALFSWLKTLVPEHHLAVDVGAGNGQATAALAACFDRVVAIEPSGSQLAHAEPITNVDYRKAAAEETGLDGGIGDLLVVAQALHWFDLDAFFSEARRVLRPGGALVVWCYGLARITPAVDALVHELYEQHLGAYWDPERRLVETGYRTIVVPFAELPAPRFEMSANWRFAELIGFLGTWSALKRHIAEHGNDANPLEKIVPRLKRAWGTVPDRTVTWPIDLRAFRA